MNAVDGNELLRRMDAMFASFLAFVDVVLFWIVMLELAWRG